MTQQLSPGDRLDGYVVLGFAAASSTTETYRVREVITGAIHALEILVKPEDRPRFTREITLMSGLNHPTIPRSYRYGEHRDRAWHGLAWVRGKASHLVVKGQAPGHAARTQQAIRFAGLAARALDHAHQRGVVHGDVKPANLLVGPDERVHLIDFGAARRIGDTAPTDPTLGFAAPEAIDGAPAAPSADLYALGATLYRIISGKMPFKGDDRGSVLKLQRAGAARPLTEVPGVPGQLSVLVAALLAADPSARPTSAELVAERLDLLAGATILPGSALAWFGDDEGGAPDTTAGDVAATAQRIGWRVGRPPPSGRAARELHDASDGLPAAIDDLVLQLVRADQVPTDRTLALWSRQSLDLPVPGPLRDAVLGRVAACNPLQQRVLQLVCRVGSASMVALERVAPRGLRESVDALVEARLLVRDRLDRLSPGSPAVARIIGNLGGGTPVAQLDDKLKAAVDDLPPSAYRLSAQLAAGRVAEAVAGAVSEGNALADAGRWRDLQALLAPMAQLESSTTPDDALARMHVLRARVAIGLGWRDAKGSKAIAAARRVLVSDSVALEVQLVDSELNTAIGHYVKVRKELDRAVELARTVTEPDQRAAVSLALGQALLWVGDIAGAASRFGAVKTLGATVAARLRARGLAGLARCEAARGDLEQAERTANASMDVTRDDLVALADAACALALAHRFRGQHSDALEALGDALAALRYAEDPRPAIQVWIAMAHCELDLSRPAAAQEHLDAITTALLPGTPPHLRLAASVAEGRLQLLTGDRKAAVFTLVQARDAAEKAGLSRIAAEARSLGFEAMGPDRAVPADLDAWFQARRIGFLASRDVWGHADECLTYCRNRVPMPAPSTLEPLEKALGARPAPGFRLQLALLRADRAGSSGDAAAAQKALREASEILDRTVRELAPAERFAMQVHPWATRIREGLEGST